MEVWAVWESAGREETVLPTWPERDTLAASACFVELVMRVSTATAPGVALMVKVRAIMRASVTVLAALSKSQPQPVWAAI